MLLCFVVIDFASFCHFSIVAVPTLSTQNAGRRQKQKQSKKHGEKLGNILQ
jgi:bacteriorhodopsin